MGLQRAAMEDMQTALADAKSQRSDRTESGRATWAGDQWVAVTGRRRRMGHNERAEPRSYDGRLATGEPQRWPEQGSWDRRPEEAADESRIGSQRTGQTVALLAEQQKKKRWILKGVILTLTLTLIIALIRYYFLWYSLQGVVWHGTISKVTLWPFLFFFFFFFLNTQESWISLY